jgi:hypothetical protein
LRSTPEWRFPWVILIRSASSNAACRHVLGARWISDCGRDSPLLDMVVRRGQVVIDRRRHIVARAGYQERCHGFWRGRLVASHEASVPTGTAQDLALSLHSLEDRKMSDSEIRR